MLKRCVSVYLINIVTLTSIRIQIDSYFVMTYPILDFYHQRRPTYLYDNIVKVDFYPVEHFLLIFIRIAFFSYIF